MPDLVNGAARACVSLFAPFAETTDLKADL